MTGGGAPDRAPWAIGADGQVLRAGGRLAAYANFVKVAHTVFALPFAVVGMVTAARSHPLQLRQVALAVAAFGAARFAAMGFNRIADERWDALNPRTAGRELPSGRMRRAEAWLLVALMGGLFVTCAALLNPLCLALSPFALAWVMGYSFTKRFTPFSHLWLGWALAIAPVGGYLAIAGAWSTPWWLLVLLAAAVACWVGGFDIIYALQDEAFDREHRLKSIPVLLGPARAIAVARVLHASAVALLAAFWLSSGAGTFFGVSVLLAGLLLAWEHRLVKADDHSRLDAAFFTMNGVIAGVVMTGALLDAAAR